MAPAHLCYRTVENVRTLRDRSGPLAVDDLSCTLPHKCWHFQKRKLRRVQLRHNLRRSVVRRSGARLVGFRQACWPQKSSACSGDGQRYRRQAPRARQGASVGQSPQRSTLSWSPSSADGVEARKTSSSRSRTAWLEGWRPGSDGLSFDLSTARKLLRTIMASSSRDLIGRSCKSKAGQARARHNCRRAVLSADCPQRGHERATVMDIVKLSVGR